MTNEEILQTLAEIRAIKNPCDRAERLAAFAPQYKKSKFYKTTHKSLQLLYYEVLIEDLLSFKTLLDNAQNFINGIDATSIQEAFDQVNLNTLSTITEGIDALNETGLADLLHKKS